jgi:hypothetical protein
LEQPAFVDPGKELLVPEEGVLSILECMYGFSPKKVAESVKGYLLDRYRAHYYLILTQQMAGGQNLLGAERLCKYKKQRKSSASKLEPLARTPMKPKTPRTPTKPKDSDLLKVPRKTENVRIRRGSVNL